MYIWCGPLRERGDSTHFPARFSGAISILYRRVGEQPIRQICYWRFHVGFIFRYVVLFDNTAPQSQISNCLPPLKIGQAKCQSQKFRTKINHRRSRWMFQIPIIFLLLHTRAHQMRLWSRTDFALFDPCKI